MKLVFIHGAGDDEGIWQKQLDCLKGATAVTLPGHPKGKLRQSVEEYADWLHQYITDNKFEEVVLVGHSMGGAISLNYAVRYGSPPLRALIIIGGGAKLKVHPASVAELEKAILGDLSGWRNLMKAAHGNVNSKLFSQQIKRRLKVGLKANMSDFACCDRFDMMSEINCIKLPTLIVCGEKDLLTPEKYSHYLASQIKDSQKTVIEGAGHFVMLEKPREVNLEIKRFLASIERTHFFNLTLS